MNLNRNCHLATEIIRDFTATQVRESGIILVRQVEPGCGRVDGDNIQGRGLFANDTHCVFEYEYPLSEVECRVELPEYVYVYLGSMKIRVYCDIFIASVSLLGDRDKGVFMYNKAKQFKPITISAVR